MPSLLRNNPLRSKNRNGQKNANRQRHGERTTRNRGELSRFQAAREFQKVAGHTFGRRSSKIPCGAEDYFAHQSGRTHAESASAKNMESQSQNQAGWRPRMVSTRLEFRPCGDLPLCRQYSAVRTRLGSASALDAL